MASSLKLKGKIPTPEDLLHSLNLKKWFLRSYYFFIPLKKHYIFFILWSSSTSSFYSFSLPQKHKGEVAAAVAAAAVRGDPVMVAVAGVPQDPGHQHGAGHILLLLLLQDREAFCGLFPLEEYLRLLRTSPTRMQRSRHRREREQFNRNWIIMKGWIKLPVTSRTNRKPQREIGLWGISGVSALKRMTTCSTTLEPSPWQNSKKNRGFLYLSKWVVRIR